MLIPETVFEIRASGAYLLDEIDYSRTSEDGPWRVRSCPLETPLLAWPYDEVQIDAIDAEVTCPKAHPSDQVREVRRYTVEFLGQEQVKVGERFTSVRVVRRTLTVGYTGDDSSSRWVTTDRVSREWGLPVQWLLERYNRGGQPVEKYDSVLRDFLR